MIATDLNSPGSSVELSTRLGFQRLQLVFGAYNEIYDIAFASSSGLPQHLYSTVAYLGSQEPIPTSRISGGIYLKCSGEVHYLWSA